MSCRRYEILVRDGLTEMAFSSHCLSCGCYGPSRPTLKSLPAASRTDQEIFDDHLICLIEAVTDWVDHVEGREAYRRPDWEKGGWDAPPYTGYHPEGVPWSEREAMDRRRG